MWATMRALTSTKPGAAASTYSTTIPAGSATDFINKFSAAAENIQRLYAIPAKFTLAQGGLESGWGTSYLAKNANNLFGVKADSSWKGPVFTTRDGLRYRKYSSAAESFKDRAEFLTRNQRYEKAFDHSDAVMFAKAVAAAGYAEDPNYAEKLSSIISTIQLV